MGVGHVLLVNLSITFPAKVYVSLFNKWSSCLAIPSHMGRWFFFLWRGSATVPQWHSSLKSFCIFIALLPCAPTVVLAFGPPFLGFLLLGMAEPSDISPAHFSDLAFVVPLMLRVWGLCKIAQMNPTLGGFHLGKSFSYTKRTRTGLLINEQMTKVGCDPVTNLMDRSNQY